MQNLSKKANRKKWRTNLITFYISQGGGISNNGAGWMGPAFFIDILRRWRNDMPTVVFQTTEKGSGVLRFPRFRKLHRGLITGNHFVVKCK
jgi:hypothetical protein